MLLPINENGNCINMDVELLSEEDEDDDAMLEAPFKRIHTPTSTVRSSTNTSTDSPSSKFKKIRVKEEANISEEVDTHLYHLSSLWNGDNKFGECPFFTSAMIKLDVCQRKLLQAFECRFSSIDDSTLWTSLFDPRYASALHLSDAEKGFAITLKHGLCYLSAVFEKASRELGRQKYPTFVPGFTCLRILKSI